MTNPFKVQQERISGISASVVGLQGAAHLGADATFTFVWLVLQCVAKGAGGSQLPDHSTPCSLGAILASLADSVVDTRTEDFAAVAHVSLM